MNTGRKIYRYLKQINTTTGLPTGVIKENVIGDTDYVPPVIDPTKCPTFIWRPINSVCELASGCPKGYSLNSAQTACEMEETVYTSDGKCPNGWEYYIPIDGRPVCRRVTTSAIIFMQTGMKRYDQREKLVNGTAALVEDNINGVGEGPYFAPVEDLTSCPKDIT